MTNWSDTTINATNYTIGLVTAGSTTVTAGSTVVLANGQDTSSDAYKQGELIIKPNDYTDI